MAMGGFARVGYRPTELATSGAMAALTSKNNPVFTRKIVNIISVTFNMYIVINFLFIEHKSPVLNAEIIKVILHWFPPRCGIFTLYLNLE